MDGVLKDEQMLSQKTYEIKEKQTREEELSQESMLVTEQMEDSVLKASIEDIKSDFSTGVRGVRDLKKEPPAGHSTVSMKTHLELIGEKRTSVEALHEDLDIQKAQAGVGKKILAGIGAAFKFMVYNPIKLVGAALWSVPCGVHAIYKGIESATSGVAWKDLDHWTPAFDWRPSKYYYDNLKFLNKKGSETSYSKEQQEKIAEIQRQQELSARTMEDEAQDRLSEIEDEKIQNENMLNALALIHDESKEDSDEMQAVKTDLSLLTGALASYKDKKVSISAIDDISENYELALSSMRHYLDVKHPRFQTGKRRYAAVKDVWTKLLLERDFLRIEKDTMVKDGIEMSESTMGELLRYDDIVIDDTVIKHVAKPISADEANHAGAEQAKGIFEAGFGFSESFSEPGMSTEKRKQLAKGVIKLRDDFRSFMPGRVEVKEMDIYGKKVRILQKGDGRLFIIDGINRIAVGRNADLMVSTIEEDMMRYSERYGDESTASLMREYKGEGRVLTSGEHLRIRQNLIDYLSSKLSLRKEDFTNVRRTVMIGYAERLIAGESAEAIKADMQKAAGSEEMINGIELTELLELDASRAAEIDAHVSVYQSAVIEEQNDWSPEEKSVKELLSELIFATDTLIMDKNVDNPAEFLREVLSSNTDAVTALIKDSKSQTLLPGILKKMSLDQIGGSAGKLGERLSTTLTELIGYLGKSIHTDGSDEEIKKELSALLSDTKNAELVAELSTINEKMESDIGDACDMLQQNVREVADHIFAKSAEENDDTLSGIMKSATKGDAGQGLFVRKVMENYFTRMNTLDKRAMLSSVFRSAKKVEDVAYSDEDIVNEIKQRNLMGYDSLKTKKNNFDPEKDLSAEEKKQIADYKEQKKKLAISSNFLGGLIRGAGPLFQKMMQGLPEETLPTELRSALRDVKSKLPPIPERVVKSQIFAMIGRSAGTVTKIDVKKSLGAASVGQTFRCVLYGPNLPKEGRSVVIKLLRPDVQNRMMREEKVMLECARDVDEGMFETYKGQLSTYKSELDFTKEAKNIREGEVYNGKFSDVESEKVNDLIAPTVNSLIIEEAEGRTLDDLLLDTTRMHEKLRADYVSDVPNFQYLITDPKNYESLKTAKKELVDKINEIIKKRDIMANICNGWITEALVGKGYYHADLHAGNILISDKKGTLIDYGNAVRFDKKQQECITQMMAAAVAGDDGIFFEAFNNLLEKTEAFENFYTEEKQNEVRAEFKRILTMGSGDDAGQRISAALIKASDMGVKLPPAIYNFSQGQLRLQKSINDINDLVSILKRDIEYIDGARSDSANITLDIISFVQTKVQNEKISAEDNGFFDWGDAINRYAGMFDPVDFEEFKKDILLHKYVEGDEEEGIEEIDERRDFEQKYLGELSDAKKKLTYSVGKGKRMLPDGAHIKAEIEKYLETYRDKKGTKEQQDAAIMLSTTLPPENYDSDIYSEFGGYNYVIMSLQNSLLEFDTEGLNEQISIYTEMIPAAVRMDEKIKELRKKQDDGEDVSDSPLIKEIYDDYNKLRVFKARRNVVTDNFERQISVCQRPDHIRKTCEHMCRDETMITVREGDASVERKLGDVFREKLEEYLTMAEPYVDENLGLSELKDEMVKSKLTEKKRELIELHYKLIPAQLKAFAADRYTQRPGIKSYDFGKIMSDVIKSNKASFISNVGALKMAKLMYKMMAG